MPTQSLLPDVLVAHSDWAGSPVIGTIDEDPNTPGGDWLDPANVGTSSPTARVGFPTPTGSPSGVQTFKARIGQTGSGGVAPTARIDLHEGGVLLAQGAEQTISTTKAKAGQVISQTFDLASTPLTTADGSGVEARVVVTASTALLNNRSASLDAVNWDTVNYTDPDTAPPVTGLGTPTRTTISAVPGWDTSDVTITANEAFVEYQLRRVPAETSTRTEGTLIETAIVAATTSLTATITNGELAGVEGPNLVKAFTRDAAGNWSTS